MRRRLIPLFVSLALATAAGDKWALLVGVDKCEAIGELKVCATDALALKSLLEQIGYPSNHITVLVDNQANVNSLPTIGNLERAIRRLAQVAESGDTVIFFFSGHGVTSGGTSYIVPTDGDLTKGVSLTWVKDQFAACKAKEKVMILDACHSGAAKGVSGITPDLKAAGGNLIMLLSCEKEQVSWPDKLGQHSVFTSAVLEGLSGKAAGADHKVTHRNLASYVRRSVKDWTYENQKTEQTPVLVADAATDIVLADRPVSLQAAPQTAAAEPPPAAASTAPAEDTRSYFTGSSLSSHSSSLSPTLFKPSPSRFTVKGNGQVADALLGKTWVIYDPDEILTLTDARSRAEQLGARLPTQQELASLLVYKKQKEDWTKINGAVFPEHKRTSTFWTDSGSVTSITMLRFVVDFSDGTQHKASSDDLYGTLLILEK